MFTQLSLILQDNCPKLTLLDIGDNKLTNKSIVNLCPLVIPDEKRIGQDFISYIKSNHYNCLFRFRRINFKC